MNKIDDNQPTELVPVPAGPGQVFAELNKREDQISKLEAELESAQKAQVVLQDAWWMMKEPSHNTFYAESQNMAMGAEVLARGTQLAIAPSRNQDLRNDNTWVWEVFYGSGVNIRASKSLKAPIIGSKDAGMVVCGCQENGWVALTEEPGFIKISESGRILMRKVQLYVMVCH